MKRMDYSMGLFVYYFGSKIQYKDVAHHTIYFGNSYEKHLDKIFEEKNYQKILVITYIDLRQQIQVWLQTVKMHFMF